MVKRWCIGVVACFGVCRVMVTDSLLCPCLVSVNSNAPLFLGKFKEDTGKISLKRYSKAGVFPNLGEMKRKGLFQREL